MLVGNSMTKQMQVFDFINKMMNGDRVTFTTVELSVPSLS